MAYVSHESCFKCERTTQHINGDCVDCKGKEDRARIAAWNSQTIEEKLQDLRIRMERLERGPARY
jgi:hypothetical protein